MRAYFPALLSNYFKITFRNLWKNKITTGITITALTLGTSGALFIGLFVLDELRYDRHFKNKDNIYRISSTFINEGIQIHSAQTNANVARALADQFPEIEMATRLQPSDDAFLFSRDHAFKEKIIFTDSSFVDVFELDLLTGNPETCFLNPGSVLISESVAIKLFGSDWKVKDVPGQTLSIDGRIPLNVTGIFKDIPEHVHFRSHLFATVPTGLGSWWSDDSRVYTYCILDENANVAELTKKINAWAAFSDKINQVQFTVEPITDIYLSAQKASDNSLHGNLKVIYGLVIAAVFLILITATNFINLLISGSFRRLKEVGIRKSLGANNLQIRNQFLLETTFVTLLSTCAAVIIVISFLPWFNQLTDKNLVAETLLLPKFVGFVLALTLGLSMFTGVFPAVFLSAKKVVEAIKGNSHHSSGIPSFRKGLIIVQFSISSVMITLSVVAYNQIKLIEHTPLGWDKENIIAIENPYMLGSTEKVLAFRNELLALEGVESISVTGYTPSQTRWGQLKITFPVGDPQGPLASPVNWMSVDEGFILTMGLHLIDGRNFIENHEHDKDAIIVNQKAVEVFNLNENGSVIGKELSFKTAEGIQTFNIVGVVNNFNVGSLHDALQPLVMRPGYHRFEMALRLSNKNHQEIIGRIHITWKKHSPLIPFQYIYVKDRFNHLHKADITASELFTWFCMLTVLMSVFGLFSIVTHTITNRTKEIGIRKILGASEKSIVWLLSESFLRLIMISYVLAIPIAWLLAHQWIDDFAYKTEISAWIFFLTGLILLLITMLTLGCQSIKASSANPVDNLRYE